MTHNNSNTLTRYFQAIVALTAWVALFLQLYILINNTPDNGMTPLQAVGRFFIFFTVLTNLLVATAMTSLLLTPLTTTTAFFSRPAILTAIAVYIFIVGLTYNLVLRPLWSPTGLQRIADELLHVAVPVLFLLYWWLYAPRQTLKYRNLFPWLAYPAIYLAYALLRGVTEGFYPYPFLDINQHGIGIVMRNAAGMFILFVMCSLLFIYIGNQLSKTKS